MDMQIPRLRKLFEARVGQISSMFAEDTPPELGDIDPTMRGLKGFLFALEGMLRSDSLQGMPFTARQDLLERVARASEAIEVLPETLDREQAMGVLRVMDSLHRLCLQENLMAGGMDASKLGKLTVILERKLGDVLESIDAVAATADGQTEKIQHAADQCLADIEGAYKKESEVLQGNSSMALDSIRSQAETIRKRYTEAMEAFDALQEELNAKRQEFEGRLGEQLATAQGVVEKVHDRQQAAVELLAESEGQLDQAKAGIKAIEEITRSAETAAEGLQAKLSEGREVTASIRGLLEDGTRDAEGISAKLAEAEQRQNSIEQILKEYQEFSAEMQTRQDQAIATVQETADAAERMLHEARQKLEARARTAENLLADINSRSAEVAAATEQTHQQRQSAEQAAQNTDENRQRAEEELAKLQDLLARGGQAAGQLDELERAGCDLKARMEQALGEAGQARDRIAQLETASSEANAAIRQGKEEALDAVGQAVSEADRRQRQFAKTVSEQRQAAKDAVAGLQVDQTAAAELLAGARQDVETLQGEIKEIYELRSTATEAESEIRAKLDQAGGVVGELGGVLAVAAELKTQIDDHLSGTVKARRRTEKLHKDTAASVEDILGSQAEALANLRGEAAAAKDQREACQASCAEQLESAVAVVGDIRTHKATADELLEETTRQRDTACQAGQDIAQVRVDTAEAGGEIQARLQEARAAAVDLEALLSAGTENRSKIDAELTVAVRHAGEIDDILRAVSESLDQARQNTQQSSEYREQSQQLLEETTRQRDTALQAGQDVAQVRVDTAESAGEIQAKLKEVRAATADLAELLSAGTESRSKIDAELTSASRRAGEIDDILRAVSESLDQARQNTQQSSEYREQSQQLLEETTRQRDTALQAGQDVAQVRVDTAESAGEIQAKLKEVRAATADLAELLSAGTESRSKIDAQLTITSRRAGEIDDIGRDMEKSLDQARKHTQQLAEDKAQSQQIISELRDNARETLDHLEGQTTELVVRNEDLHQKIEDLFGQAVDGGLFRQFDDLVEQTAPQREKWWRLLIGVGAGGGVVLAIISAILAGFSAWAAVAVLAAGLTPLAFFLYVCATQYVAERRAESRYQYRAAVSRSVTAYRKLLVEMKADGIADSTFVDRMLSALFGSTGRESEPAQLAPTAAAEPLDTTDSEQETA